MRTGTEKKPLAQMFGPKLCVELSYAVHCDVGSIVALFLLEVSDPPINTV